MKSVWKQGGLGGALQFAEWAVALVCLQAEKKDCPRFPC